MQNAGSVFADIAHKSKAIKNSPGTIFTVPWEFLLSVYVQLKTCLIQYPVPA